MGFLENIIEYMKPKAHDAIDSLTEKWEQRNEGPSVLEGMEELPYSSEDILGLVMGVGGGGGAKIGKLAKKVSTKIKARNAKAIRDLTSGELKGQQTLKPADAKWLREQGTKWEQGLHKKIGGSDIYSYPKPENMLSILMLGLASPLIAKNLKDVGYGQFEGSPPDIGRPPKQF